MSEEALLTPILIQLTLLYLCTFSSFYTLFIIYHILENVYRHEKLEVVSANIFDSESLVPVLEGKNAVLSCLGAHGTSVFNRTKLYSTSMKAISTAMERYG